MPKRQQKRQNNERLPDSPRRATPSAPASTQTKNLTPSIHSTCGSWPWFPSAPPPLLLYPSFCFLLSIPPSCSLLLFPPCSKMAAGQTTDGMDRGQVVRSNSSPAHKRNELMVVASNAALKIKERTKMAGCGMPKVDHKYSVPECARRK